MTATEARIALEKLGWTRLLLEKRDGQWWALIGRHDRTSCVWCETSGKTRREAIDRIVLWAQQDAEKHKRMIM